jgi:hypothetical protein
MVNHPSIGLVDVFRDDPTLFHPGVHQLRRDSAAHEDSLPKLKDFSRVWRLRRGHRGMTAGASGGD